MFANLRSRIALVTFASSALTLFAVGAFLINNSQQRATDRIDNSLRNRVAALSGSVASVERASSERDERASTGENHVEAPPVDEGPEGGDRQATLALLNGKVVYSAGTLPAAILRTTGGPKTVNGQGGPWRVLERTVENRRVIAATSLLQSQARFNDLRDQAIVIGLIGLAISAAAGWFAAGYVTRSLRRLRDAADRVSGTEDLAIRVPDNQRAEELADLSHSINAMLARIEQEHAETTSARDAARRFASDAGHELRTPLAAMGTNIDMLSLGNRLSEQERSDLAKRLAAEQARLVRLLDSLQALARGETTEDLPLEDLDLSEIAGASMMTIRAGHPDARFDLETPDIGVPYRGHPEGIRRICENLLENAFVHGKPGGRAVITVEGEPNGGAKIICEDDGPGIPAADRLRVVERFERGSSGGSGSGLGLALVAQQANLHHGNLIIDDSPVGGARVTVSLGPPLNGRAS